MFRSLFREQINGNQKCSALHTCQTNLEITRAYTNRKSITTNGKSVSKLIKLKSLKWWADDFWWHASVSRRHLSSHRQGKIHAKTISTAIASIFPGLELNQLSQFICRSVVLSHSSLTADQAASDVLHCRVSWGKSFFFLWQQALSRSVLTARRYFVFDVFTINPTFPASSTATHKIPSHQCVEGCVAFITIKQS